MTEQQNGAKPGRKSTEFGMTWLMGVVAGGAGIADDSEIVRMAAVIALGFLGGMYALSRGRAKHVGRG